jgi:uncharacterized protein (DUF433 family)
MKHSELIGRITCDPDIFGGKPVIRGHRLAVEHILDLLAAGDDAATILSGYPWMEPEDVRACLAYASLLARNERIELFPEPGSQPAAQASRTFPSETSGSGMTDICVDFSGDADADR